jgi:alpha-glucosidase
MLPVLEEIRGLLDEQPGRTSVGEVDDLDMALRYVGPGRLHMAFNFDFLGTRWLPRLFMESIKRYEDGLAPDAWPTYVLGNHDRDRLASRFGAGPYSDARSRVAATLLLTQRGTPFVYYGDELGMLNAPLGRDDIQDPAGKLYWPMYQGRDPERTPMQWSAEPQAGFSPNPPWLRVNADFVKRNVAAQDADAHSVLNTYRALLQLRRQSAALRRGTTRFVVKRPVEGLAYLRETPEQTLLVALNFFGWAIDLKLEGPLPADRWQVLFSTAEGDVPRIMGNRMRLQPFEAVVLEAQRGA